MGAIDYRWTTLRLPEPEKHDELLAVVMQRNPYEKPHPRRYVGLIDPWVHKTILRIKADETEPLFVVDARGHELLYATVPRPPFDPESFANQAGGAVRPTPKSLGPETSPHDAPTWCGLISHDTDSGTQKIAQTHRCLSSLVMTDDGLLVGTADESPGDPTSSDHSLVLVDGTTGAMNPLTEDGVNVTLPMTARKSVVFARSPDHGHQMPRDCVCFVDL